MNKFLRVGDVPADVVDRCCTKIDDSEHSYSLNRLLAKATQRGNTEEDKYEPLVSLAEHESLPPILIIPPPSPQRNIFDIIEGADSDTPRRVCRCTREIIITTSTALKGEEQRLPNLLRDMSVVDVDPSEVLVECPSIAFRRQAVSFIEIKLHDREDTATFNG
jgi:hypothetical protein